MNSSDKNRRLITASTPSQTVSPTKPKIYVNLPSPADANHISFIENAGGAGANENFHYLNGSDLISTSGLANGSHHFNPTRTSSLQVKSFPLLANNNINNVSANSEDVISFQRIRKVVTEDIDQLIRAKEDYVKNLRSIDLNKFSFPNENKPKTDYTYAKTSSYLIESTAVCDDDVMPNLCRRGRKSPSQIAQSWLAAKPRFPSLLSTASLSEFNQAITDRMNVSMSRISLYEHVSNLFGRKRETAETSSTTKTSGNSQATSNVNNSNASKINKNLLSDLDEETANQQQKQYKVKYSYGLDCESGGSSSSGSSSSSISSGLSSNLNSNRGSAASSQQATTSNTYNLRSSSAKSKVESVAVNRGGINEEPTPRTRQNKSTCCEIPWWGWILILAVLAAGPLFFLYSKNVDSANSWSSYDKDTTLDSNPISTNYHYFVSFMDSLNKHYTSIGEYFSSFTKQHTDLYFSSYEWGLLFEQVIDKAKQISSKTVNWLVWLVELIYTFLTALLETISKNILKAFSLLFQYLMEKKDELSKKIPEIKDFKLSTVNFNNENEINKQLIEQLNAIKENILAETVQNSRADKSTDAMAQQLRTELDQKFNFTLTLMSNKLADQHMQHELSKSSQDQELKQIKQVLDKLQTDYKLLLQQLEQQRHEIHSTQQKQQQEATTTSSPLQQPNSSKESSDRDMYHKLEEFIERSFFLYNADRTGMTDFASEPLGASVLFTRCTENYLHNSRWFTFFNVPLSRITVSPRVIIQSGQMQPGNCWAFKGDKADLFIKLAAPITPSSFSIEHIPKELSLTGVIDSAPQNFTIYGFASPEDISDDKRLLLGNFRYDNSSKNTLQFFKAQYEYLEKPIAAVELKIESNAGNPEYTCLYKFRVHGSLFHKDKSKRDDYAAKPNSIQNEINDNVKTGN